jgi:hypothetical protein
MCPRHRQGPKQTFLRGMSTRNNLGTLKLKSIRIYMSQLNLLGYSFSVRTLILTSTVKSDCQHYKKHFFKEKKHS